MQIVVATVVGAKKVPRARGSVLSWLAAATVLLMVCANQQINLNWIFKQLADFPADLQTSIRVRQCRLLQVRVSWLAS